MMRSGISSTVLSMASPPSLAVWTLANGARPCRNISSTIGLSSTKRTLTFAGISLNFLAGVVAGFSARFPVQNDLSNLNALVEGFAHVVDGEGGDAGGDQRFHFHASSGRSRYF